MSHTSYTFSALVLTALALGFWHGFDYDHIAAVDDLTGTQGAGRAITVGRAYWLAMLYALGHSASMLVIGASITFLGMRVPHWLDGAMERVVGLTLLVMGGWMLVSFLRAPGQVAMRSRWLFLGDRCAAFAARRRAARRGETYIPGLNNTPGPVVSRASFGIGMLHGIGAETATQVVLFGAAAMTGGAAAVTVLLAFCCGLIGSNLVVASISIFLLTGVRRIRPLYHSFGWAMALYSAVIGVLFLTGGAGGLPDVHETLVRLAR